ncbi:TRAP transporter small permease [Cereibacter sp. SYSU M97828]|nr:TRAP transporter small permease [Cereibacter flavus]
MSDLGNPVADRIESVIMAISEASAWIYFFIGAIVTFEVVARYVFHSPTDWVEEISRLGMVWATFLLLAVCLAQRQLITITLISNSLGDRGKMILEAIIFLIIGTLAFVIGCLAFGSVMTMISMGRATNSTLALPYWAFYLPICIGFLMLSLQAIMEFLLVCLTGKRRRIEFGHEDI